MPQRMKEIYLLKLLFSRRSRVFKSSLAALTRVHVYIMDAGRTVNSIPPLLSADPCLSPAQSVVFLWFIGFADIPLELGIVLLSIDGSYSQQCILLLIGKNVTDHCEKDRVERLSRQYQYSK